MIKRVITLILTIAIIASLAVVVYADGTPSKSDLDKLRQSIKITYPKKSSYLSEYVYGCVKPGDNNNYIYWFTQATTQNKATSNSRLMTAGEELTIIAREGKRICVINTDQGVAGWVNPENVYLYDIEELLSDAPCDADLNAIFSNISKPTPRAYFSEYEFGEIAPQGSNHAVKGYTHYKFTEKDDKRYFLGHLQEGEQVIVLAELGSRYCVISLDTSRAAWVNSSLVEIY